jgi:magnesium-transporting ATPase (P-type)
VLGPVEASWSLLTFVLVLSFGGWHVGETPPAELLATASGSAFAAIVVGQLANAFACRSESRWVGRTGMRGNPLLLMAVAVEVSVLVVLLVLPPVASLLGGTWPSPAGWLLALGAAPALLTADTVQKALRSARTSREVSHDLPRDAEHLATRDLRH